MLVLGTSASQNTKSFLTTYVANYESIASVSIPTGNSQASVTFTSIPSTYKHLQLRAIYRSTGTNVYNAWFTGTINSDSGANYSTHAIYGNGSTAGAISYTSTSIIDGFSRPGADSGGGYSGAMILDILDYANTNKYKTIQHFAGVDINITTTRLDVGLYSNNWRSTSAINTISFYGNQGNFSGVSHFALYGIK